MSDERNTRAASRSKVAIDLSMHVVTAEGRHPVRCLGVDISRGGLGIVCFEALAEGGEVILVLASKGIALKVAWCKPDTVRDRIFHVGLGTNDPSINLAKLLAAEGLLVPDGNGDAKATSRKPPPLMFSALRDALATAHTPDSGAFRTGNWAKLASSYNAYPINHQGVSLYILLPKDLRPSEASKLDEGCVIRRIPNADSD